MLSVFRLLPLSLSAVILMATAPSHVQTADYFAGYAGTRSVAPSRAAQSLSWVETDIAGANSIAPLGVKTLDYTDPFRVIPSRQAYYSNVDDSAFAHDCTGARIATTNSTGQQMLMDPHSPALVNAWRNEVQRVTSVAHFDAIFVDDAIEPVYTQGKPCNFDPDDWIKALSNEISQLGHPVVYNGLSDWNDQRLPKEIALNSVAIGGMMEECYAFTRGQVSNDWRWRVTENTEITMARQHKYFFCYGNDTSDADQSLDRRLYVYASFLLTYDIRTSVLWEYFMTPSRGHVMPESQVVALNPVTANVPSIDRLRTAGGVYTRAYRNCFIAGAAAGPCVAAVNPDATSAHSVSLDGYHRTLVLSGSGVFDGGTVGVANQGPPSSLGPMQAVIAFK